MNRRSETAGLDRLQSGHLRHFDNLSRSLPNDWSLMKGRSFGQDDFGAYRFQLAYMLYALALTHLHRLPAAPGLFKPIYERLFEKLLLPEVWIYWHDTSRGGSIFNQHLAHTYKEEWDPVARDNIMYSAYIQSLALLFNYLFDDDRYAKPGSLSFKFWSYFWGGEPKVFAYDQNSLNDHIYWLMVQSGYIGVACEPNCVFQICNQPAILGFRLHDLLTGGSRAEEVIKGYEAAWREFGRIGENGHYNMMVAEDTKKLRQNVGKAPWVDAWCGALMNMWNRDFVREHYPAQIRDLVVEGGDGTLSVRTGARPQIMGERVITDDCDFGWVAVWASEMGDASTLDGLLRHADRFMNPTWRDGGLYYPRNDRPEDAFGNRTLMEPHTGNTLLGYARLNVPDGLWRLFNEPLDAGFFKNPALIEVAQTVDVQRAVFVDNTLHFRLAVHEGEGGGRNVTVGRLGSRGPWRLECDGHEIARGEDSKVTTSSYAGIVAEADGVTVQCPSSSVHDFEMRFG
jgi:Linalool dehydratase/isomerase